MKDQIKDKFKEFFKDDKKAKIVILLGIAGMLLILFSDFLFGGGDKKESSVTAKTNTAQNTSASEYDEVSQYAKDAEARLKTILESMDGVGKSEVMVNVTSTKEYVYAQDSKTSKSEDDNTTASDKENNYVIIEKDGNDEALTQRINTPVISGIVVSCEGGDSNVMREKITLMISSVFDIPVSNVYVTKLK